MSDAKPKPFADVCVRPSGTFQVIYHGPDGDLPSLFLWADRGQAEAEAHWLNEAVAGRERVAAAKAMSDFADVREIEAKALPLGIAYHGGPLHDAPVYDVLMSEVRSLRARADAVERGEA